MKLKRIRALVLTLTLSVSLLLSPALAAETETVSFSDIMDLVESASLTGENKDVLRAFFEQYFEAHPEELVPIVNEIMQSLDSHSMYLTKEEYDNSFGQTFNDYVGIGIALYKAENGYVLSDVFSDGPAGQAGLQSGDLILAVDDVDVTKMELADVRERIRGEADTTVRITVQREQEQITVTVKRAMVTPEHVTNRTIAPGIEYIKITAMGSMWDLATFYDIWNRLPAKDIRTVILDLRGNGGGLVSMAQGIIDEVVPQEGIKYLGLRYREEQGGLEEFYTSGGGLPLNKMVILVDGATASAAEIVAGSLSDLGVATLVGTRTYGKGVGQYHLPMPDGSVLIMTTMEIQLPKRGVYEGTGLIPNLLVKRTDAVKNASFTDLDTTKELVPGTTGATITALTERLTILGFLDGRNSRFEDQVLGAVRRFQKANGLLQTGIADVLTLQKLDEQATAIFTEDVAGDDAQLATAVRLCREALLESARFTVNADGTWSPKA